MLPDAVEGPPGIEWKEHVAARESGRMGPMGRVAIGGPAGHELAGSHGALVDVALGPAREHRVVVG